MSNFEAIIYEKQDGVAHITLSRPQVLNAYNIAMRDELYEVLLAISDDPEVRVVVLRGAGERAFCAGADLSEFLTAPSPTIAREVRWQRDVWGLFLNIEKPVIGALHGYVLGSGLEMALCCDIRIASLDVQFRVPEPGLGIIPAAGGTQTLPRVVGEAAALDSLLTGRWIKADEARRLGLVSKLVDRGDLWPEADRLAGRLRHHSQAALSCAKQAVTRGFDLTLGQGLELEADLGDYLLSVAD